MPHRPFAFPRRIRLGLALTCLLAGLAPAHATFPGDNGPIVFDFGNPRAIGRVSPGQPGITTLTHGFSPRVSPSGRQIAFLRGELNMGKDVHVMDMDGSRIVPLTTDASAHALAWTRDGSRLVYVAEAADGSGARVLWTMRPDGTGRTLWGQLPSAIQRYSLEGSPAADTFIYESWDHVLWSTPSGSPNARRVKDGVQFPTWSPDGATVVYGALAIRGISPDGTNDRVLLDTPYPGRSVISPDGKQLASKLGTSASSALTTWGRSSLQVSASWPVAAGYPDWARVPRNCHATTPLGGGGVLADDLAFYAEECTIAVAPEPAPPGGVLAQALSLGPDARLYARTLKTPRGGGAAVWSAPALVPGRNGSLDGIKPLKIALAAARDGSFQVVVVNAEDKALYHALQNPNGSWSGFARLDGWAGGASFQARDVAIAISGSSSASPGRLQVVASDLAQGQLYHRVRQPGGHWTAFDLAPASRGKQAVAVAMAASDDLYANVVVITSSPDGAYRELQQVVVDSNGNWGTWVRVPTTVAIASASPVDVAVARTGTNGGPAHLLILDAEGRAWWQTRPTPNLTSSWQGEAPTELVTTDGRSVSLSSAGSSTRILVTRSDPQ